MLHICIDIEEKDSWDQKTITRIDKFPQLISQLTAQPPIDKFPEKCIGESINKYKKIYTNASSIQLDHQRCSVPNKENREGKTLWSSASLSLSSSEEESVEIAS